jgi:hypothetical protein
MKVLFCPPASMGNSIEEREYEEIVATAFNARVDSLLFHYRDSREELFELVCSSDAITIMVEATDEITAYVIHVAEQLKKPIYHIYHNCLIRQ